jgi:uncharacterized protein YxjI
VIEWVIGRAGGVDPQGPELVAPGHGGLDVLERAHCFPALEPRVVDGDGVFLGAAPEWTWDSHGRNPTPECDGPGGRAIGNWPVGTIAGGQIALNTGLEAIERSGRMGLLHRHHQSEGTRYQMREKVFAIGDDYWVEGEGGARVFKVNGKALRLRNTFVLEDTGGQELLKIQEKKLHIRDTMEVERDGDTVATIKKALITPLRDRFSIELQGGGELSAKGNIVDHEYEIERDGHKVAEISKRWFRVRDTYGIEIAPGENDALIVAATVCIDEMAGR